MARLPGDFCEYAVHKMEFPRGGGLRDAEARMEERRCKLIGEDIRVSLVAIDVAMLIHREDEFVLTGEVGGNSVTPSMNRIPVGPDWSIIGPNAVAIVVKYYSLLFPRRLTQANRRGIRSVVHNRRAIFSEFSKPLGEFIGLAWLEFLNRLDSSDLICELPVVRSAELVVIDAFGELLQFTSGELGFEWPASAGRRFGRLRGGAIGDQLINRGAEPGDETVPLSGRKSAERGLRRSALPVDGIHNGLCFRYDLVEVVGMSCGFGELLGDVGDAGAANSV